MAKINIVFNGIEYSIDETVFSDAATKFGAHLSTMTSSRTLAPGLYRTGSNYTELVTSWDALVTNGDVTVEDEKLTGINKELSGDLVVPSSVTMSYCYVAYMNDCQITGIVFSEGLTQIVSESFYKCPNLTHVILPASLEKIGSDNFGMCPALTTIEYKGTVEQWGNVTVTTDLPVTTVHCADGDYQY